MIKLNMNELFEIADEMEERIGTITFLQAILEQMNKTELYEALEFIDRMNDTNMLILIKLNMNELFEIADEMEERIGTITFLQAILEQMNKTELYEALEFVDRMHDTNMLILTF